MKSRLVGVALAAVFAAGCSDGGGTSPNSGDYWRSDSPSLKTGWRATMPGFEAAHMDEAAVVEALGLDASTRMVIDASLNRVGYATPTGTVSMFYDEGPSRPFHSLRYERSTEFVAQTWTSSSELQRLWAEGAAQAASYLKKVTTLTPVLFVGRGTDVERAAALNEGYEFLLAVDGWPVFIDDLEVLVDADGIAVFETDELPSAASESGTIDCRSQAEVEALVAAGGGAAADVGGPPPIFYAFDTERDRLSPLFLAVSTGNGDTNGPFAVPLDRTATD